MFDNCLPVLPLRSIHLFSPFFARQAGDAANLILDVAQKMKNSEALLLKMAIYSGFSH